MNAPSTHPAPAATEKADDIILEVRGLKTYFPVKKGIWRRVVGHVKAVDGVDLTLRRGETLGLVGESGCGKTTLGRSIIRLIEPTAGSIHFHHGGERIDLMQLGRGEMRRLRRELQYIFQDPFSSLNPWMNVFDIVSEPLVVNRVASGSELRGRVESLIRRVGLKPDHLRRYPYAFSGGQRQRIGIARALALNPSLIIADEPVSALDVSVQAQILNLLEELQDEFNLTYIFVAHDLSVVEHISDRVAVMYLGEIVETAESGELYRNPSHPYTAALLSAVLDPDPDRRPERPRMKGIVPDPADAPPGCKFHTRCLYAEPHCAREVPVLREVAPGHESKACASCLERMRAEATGRAAEGVESASDRAEDVPHVSPAPLAAPVEDADNSPSNEGKQ
ncbi:MAG: ABC transporter ATP-binding protein [Opitutales bacterium]|nr:ABC transporter ATP-binding protein [Opitutales bacterium]